MHKIHACEAIRQAGRVVRNDQVGTTVIRGDQVGVPDGGGAGLGEGLPGVFRPATPLMG